MHRDRSRGTEAQGQKQRNRSTGTEEEGQRQRDTCLEVSLVMKAEMPWLHVPAGHGLKCSAEGAVCARITPPHARSRRTEITNSRPEHQRREKTASVGDVRLNVHLTDFPSESLKTTGHL
uniref:Uncharacterized protein n=1 Tax=Knipowitschia caucasica TaxID=637954 RepID=A0AAV2IXV8_KNICA